MAQASTIYIYGIINYFFCEYGFWDCTALHLECPNTLKNIGITSETGDLNINIH